MNTQENTSQEQPNDPYAYLYYPDGETWLQTVIDSGSQDQLRKYRQWFEQTGANTSERMAREAIHFASGERLPSPHQAAAMDIVTSVETMISQPDEICPRKDKVDLVIDASRALFEELQAMTHTRDQFFTVDPEGIRVGFIELVERELGVDIAPYVLAA